MDPSRKRKIRLVVALCAAVFLASALVYTSFSASSEAKSPSQLLSSAKAGSSYQLTGKVVANSVSRSDGVLRFRVMDRDGRGAQVPVVYRGAVPDPFREGREVIINVHKGTNGTFVGEGDSLVTKCPSKFTSAESKTT
jgi:cytochrome c-type biogenesis protein CcmE